jgi:hypothetical protein
MKNSKEINNLEIKGGKLFSNEVAKFNYENISCDILIDLSETLVYTNHSCHNSVIYTYSLDPSKNSYSNYAYLTDKIISLLEDKFEFEQKDFYIDDILYDFIIENNLITFFKYKLEPFGDYDTFEILKENSLLRMTNSSNGNKLDLKIGRYLTKVNTYLNLLTSQKIEQLATRYKSMCEENIEFTYLVGDDIKEGYKTDNYDIANNSSLWGSCMNNKTSYLKIYTKNPNVVKLAVLKKNMKIQARCFVWKINDKFYFDKIYYYKEHQINIMKEKLESDNVLSINSLQFASVKLDFCDFTKYPYLDTFRLLHMDTKTLIYFEPETNYRLLHDQYGEYEDTAFVYTNAD